MPLTLKGSLSSDYLKAAHKLYSKKSRRRIVAYVESYDDIAFWRSLLEKYEDETRYFQVMLPSSRSLTKGKKMVLTNTVKADNFGESLIACVDSDYDYLLQGANPTSKVVNTSKYVFHTYTYAIENYFCFAEGLHEVCVEATLNDKSIFDFEAYLVEFSQLIYPLFLWTIWFYGHADTNSFTMSQFNSLTRVYSFRVNEPERSLERIKQKVTRKLEELERNFPDLVPKVEKMGEELKSLGLMPTNTYLFIQGHHLFEQVVIKLLRPVCAVLRQQRESYIKRLAVHDEQYNNELTSYRNSITDVEHALKKSFGFRNLFAYHWLREDLQQFVDGLS